MCGKQIHPLRVVSGGGGEKSWQSSLSKEKDCARTQVHPRVSREEKYKNEENLVQGEKSVDTKNQSCKVGRRFAGTGPISFPIQRKRKGTDKRPSLFGQEPKKEKVDLKSGAKEKKTERGTDQWEARGAFSSFCRGALE